MAELTFKSAGVSTREIDLSAPTPQSPQGIPAGVVGTSVEGPAFVPITFGSMLDFTTIFGLTDGKKFGPLAVNEWMKSAKAGTFIRVLGVGDGKRRATDTGIVTNAGFVVGEETVQSNNFLGPNSFSNETAGIKGRTYFLGTYMSESNGSTIFSEAGIQNFKGLSTATKVDILEIGGEDPNDRFDVVVPVAAGGDGITRQIIVGSTGLGSASPTANQIFYAGTGANSVRRANLISVFTGEANTALVKFGTNTPNTGIPGLTAAAGSTNKITVSATNSGEAGNTITLTLKVDTSSGNPLMATAVDTAVPLAGGKSGAPAAPILRGVLLAPSGVILHLSGNNMAAPAAPLLTDTAVNGTERFMGQKGGITGSVNLSSQEFVMLMNGYKGDSSSKKTHITASFDMNSLNYFPNVFNTDPLKIEEEGHYLYGHYDINPAMAKVTGSAAITAGSENGNKLDIAFLLTGSQPHGAASSVEHADYEDFQDRFTHAESPFVISQGFDSPSGVNLFKFVALDSGVSGAGRYKISIENLNPVGDTQYGTFDVLIRDFSDTDEERRVLESHRGLTLDPGSDRYIGRVIGDQHIFFNFDSDAESQKIIVDGVHPSKSRYVRVELSNELKKKEVPQEALPFGFRGPAHLNTSGSLLSNEMSTSFTHTERIANIVEPPFPKRSRISVGIDLNKVLNTRLYWGMKSSQTIDPADPNKVAAFNESINTYGTHFPKHRVGVTPFAIGNNQGVTDLSGGTVLDCDRFNNNRFSLEKIKVITGSDGRADPSKWIDATYTRDGNIVTDTGTKTRAFLAKDLKTTSNRKFAKFTLPMQGGFDGTNIFDQDKKKLSNNAVKREMDDDNQGKLAGPTVAAYRKAVDIMGSKTDSDIQILAIPGIRHPSVTDFAISAVENRFDAIYIMDIEQRDNHNNVVVNSSQKIHVLNTVNDFKNRALDSSFAAAYFPDLTVVDPETGALVSTPPSVAVLGAYGNNDSAGHPWTAPAGFTRGALSAVQASDVLLNRTNLDDLYDADINPITAFPGTGITVWGQKTLLEGASALDRVNVRRLLIYVRRKVRNIANTLLFEPNRAETLEKFSSLVNPVLQRVQDQAGVDRYKVIIDTTTTTQADIENNTIRGKIFLQPTRTVEFVALDFFVTNAGANSNFDNL